MTLVARTWVAATVGVMTAAPPHRLVVRDLLGEPLDWSDTMTALFEGTVNPDHVIVDLVPHGARRSRLTNTPVDGGAAG